MKLQINVDKKLKLFSSYRAMSPLIYLLAFVTTAIIVKGDSSKGAPTIKTQQGIIQGTLFYTKSNKIIEAFLGIPYAKPPLGKLRFRRPEPFPPWEGEMNATSLPNSCMQLLNTKFGNFSGSTMWNPNTPISEDCLYLNVWSPYPRQKHTPVMVWIHGGGFYSGTSTLDAYDPRTLVSEHNVIFVSMNYRLGSFGFLYFGTPEAPGNVGLWDQQLALKWVHDNIKAVGGDPTAVTLFGESTGSACVSMHLLSPHSENLFNRAILQSGSVLSPVATINAEMAKERSKQLTENSGCTCSSDTLEAAIECLREVDALELLKMEWHEDLGFMDIPFYPVIDGHFIKSDPKELMLANKSKKAEIMMGSNRNEGSMILLYNLKNYFFKKEDISITRDKFMEIVKELHPYLGTIAHHAIFFEYTNWRNPNSTKLNRIGLEHLVGDYYITCSVANFAQLYADAGNDVYMYQFAQRSSVNPWPKWTGIIHGEEIAFVFGAPVHSKKGYRREELILSRRMMAYWTNFAKNGNPNIGMYEHIFQLQWPTYSPSQKEYLILHGNYSLIKKGVRPRKCEFWENYLPKMIIDSGHDF